MNEVFIWKIGYEPFIHRRLSESLFDNAFQKTKEKVTKVLKASPLFNIVYNKIDNIKSKCIFNITVLTKEYNAFYIFLKSKINQRLDVIANT